MEKQRSRKRAAQIHSTHRKEHHLMYSLDLGIWNSVFAVPSILVDKHIKMAGSAQLKVLLYLLRHAGSSDAYENLPKAVGLSKADTSDALQYWLETGILKESENTYVPAEPLRKEFSKPDYTTKETAKKVDSKPPSSSKVYNTGLPKISHSEAAKRMKESEMVKLVLRYAETCMKKILNPSEQAVLISICDNSKLPTDLIYMVMEYARLQGKPTVKKIEEIAMDWSYGGINTHALAERKLTEMYRIEESYQKLCEALSINEESPKPQDKQTADLFLYEWKFSTAAVKRAYDICVEKIGKFSFPYTKTILSGWNEKGIKNVADIDKTTRKDKPKKEKRETSYDIGEIEKMIHDQYLDEDDD